LSDGFEITNLSGVIRFLTQNTEKVEKAAVYALGQVALAVEAQAKHNFQGVHRQNGVTKGGYPLWEPRGHIQGFPDYPNVRTGALRRSIRTRMESGARGYTAIVEPGMIYARNVEVKLGYQFMRPARNEVAKQADQIFTKAFKRKMGN
jgi:hypothetical protein